MNNHLETNILQQIGRTDLLRRSLHHLGLEWTRCGLRWLGSNVPAVCLIELPIFECQRLVRVTETYLFSLKAAGYNCGTIFISILVWIVIIIIIMLLKYDKLTWHSHFNQEKVSGNLFLTKKHKQKNFCSCICCRWLLKIVIGTIIV